MDKRSVGCVTASVSLVSSSGRSVRSPTSTELPKSLPLSDSVPSALTPTVFPTSTLTVMATATSTTHPPTKKAREANSLGTS